MPYGVSCGQIVVDAGTALRGGTASWCGRAEDQAGPAQGKLAASHQPPEVCSLFLNYCAAEAAAVAAASGCASTAPRQHDGLAAAAARSAPLHHLAASAAAAGRSNTENRSPPTKSLSTRLTRYQLVAIPLRQAAPETHQRSDNIKSRSSSHPG